MTYRQTRAQEKLRIVVEYPRSDKGWGRDRNAGDGSGSIGPVGNFAAVQNFACGRTDESVIQAFCSNTPSKEGRSRVKLHW